MSWKFVYGQERIFALVLAFSLAIIDIVDRLISIYFGFLYNPLKVAKVHYDNEVWVYDM